VNYIDGYLVPVPTKNLKAYFAMAKKASKVWMDHGALQYCEAVGEDMAPGFGIQFPKLLALKKGESAVFSFIVYKSRRHRDAVNAKVMKDPRLASMMDPKNMPFDCTRMAYGGFKSMVES
jgi:uncharacterized protein YbaA (DUF1428 family)